MKPAYIIIGFVAFDLLILMPAIFWLVFKFAWKPWMLEHPACAPSDDAVRKNFQSFRFGSMNFGGCIHAAVDETYLHLTPVTCLGWFGAGPVSIPWEAVTEAEAYRGSNKWMRVKIGGKLVLGPSWCLELAQPKVDDSPQE